MNGNVFQCHDETTKTLQFTKTVRQLHYHVMTTLEFCQDVDSICTRFELTPLAPPDYLTEEEAKSPVKRMLREAEVNLLEKRRHIVASNIRAIYDVAWGQCSPKMQAKLTAMNEYEEKSFARDCIWLLKSINSIATQQALAERDPTLEKATMQEEAKLQQVSPWHLSTMSEINEGSHGGFSDDDTDVLTEDERTALIHQFFDEMDRKDLEDGLERNHHERVEYALQELNNMSSIPRCRPPESWWTLPTGIAEENIVASFEESRFVSNEPEDENDDGADVLDFNDPGRYLGSDRATIATFSFKRGLLP
jgi:hypothetical protein